VCSNAGKNAYSNREFSGLNGRGYVWPEWHAFVFYETRTIFLTAGYRGYSIRIAYGAVASGTHRENLCSLPRAVLYVSAADLDHPLEKTRKHNYVKSIVE